MLYLIFFLVVIFVNILPAFAPPTWTFIVFFLNYFDLNIYLVIIIAVIAATIGRYILYSYSEWLAGKVFNDWGKENLKFLGESLGKTPKRNFLFVLIYSMTPLSTTALFVAGGLAKVNRVIILTGFALGRMVSYSFLAFTSKVLIDNFGDIFKGSTSIEKIITSALGLIVLLFFIFLDWKELVQNHKIKVNFKVWRWDRL
jgi:membrane protein YqaA with SNARE-associated domain